ncbi:MAG TPA: hypothetical protein VFY71_13930 [Planctomycetota bacterium]|nr:hypothetical protein [Planctomycetota bacterium]
MLSFRPGRVAGWRGAAMVLVLAGAAVAATVQRLDFAGLTQLSSHVVTGRVLSSAPQWTPDGGAVVTLHQIAVAAAWKGEAGETISVRTPGGRMGDYVMTMPGAPELADGDTVLLFLERNDQGSFDVVSLAQGSYRVATAPDGTFVVTRDTGAQQLVAPSKSGLAGLEAVQDTLASVHAQVDAALAAERAGPIEPQEVVVPLDDVVQGGGK